MEMSYAHLIKTIDETLEKRTNSELCRYNLTASQMRVLMALYRTKEAMYSFKELEKTVHLSQATVQGLVARMEKKGFLETLAHPEDRRVKMIKLTKCGQDLMRQAVDADERTQLWLTAALSEREALELRSLLFKVYASLQ